MFKNMKWVVAAVILMLPAGSQAAFEYESILKAAVDGPIVDVAAHPDADLVFVLTPGKILIYSTDDQVVLDQIPVDKGFDRITYQDDDRLVLTARQPSRINILHFSRIYTFNLKGRAVNGPPDAKATIVVFDDYQCPYCARLENYIQQLLEQFPKDLNCVIKHYPLPSHPLADDGARAALAAGKQGKFWEFHSRLLAEYNQVSEEKILEIAGSLGLDMETFNRDRMSSAVSEIIQEDVADGKFVGVRGTPTVFLNGKRVKNPGALPDLIRQEIEKKGRQ